MQVWSRFCLFVILCAVYHTHVHISGVVTAVDVVMWMCCGAAAYLCFIMSKQLIAFIAFCLAEAMVGIHMWQIIARASHDLYLQCTE